MPGGVDLSTLAVAIDSSGSKTGADLAVASAERIKTATTSMHQTLQQTPVVLQSLVDGHQRVTQELVRTETATVGFTAKTAAAVDPLARVRDELLANINATRSYADRIKAASEAVQQTAPVTTVAAEGFGKLRAPLQTATIALAGLPGPAGRVVSTLGQFAIGSGLMLGATAGVAALSALITKLKEDAEEAERPLLNLIEKADRLRAARLAEQGVTLGLDLVTANQAAIEAADALDALRARIEQVRAAAGAGGRDRDLGAVLLGNLEAQAAAAERQLRLLQETRDEFQRAQDEKKAKEKAEEEREREATLRHLRAVAAEQDRIRKQQMEDDQRRLRLLLEINNQFLNNQPSRLGSTRLGSAAEAARGADLVARFTTLPAGQTVGGGDTGIIATIRRRHEAYLDSLQAVADEEAEIRARQIAAMRDTREAAIDLVARLGVVPDAFLDVADGISRVIDDLARRRAKDPTAGLSSANVLDLVGTGVGIVQSILGARRQAELEAARFRAATADWERSLTRFADSIGGQSQLVRALQDLEDQFLAFADQAAARHSILVGGDAANFTTESITERQAAIARRLRNGVGRGELEDLLREARFLEDLAKARRLEAKAIEEARRAFAQQEASYRDEIAARLADAEGRSDAAASIRLFARQQAERLEAERTGYDQVTRAALAHVQALEAEALARELAIAATARARQGAGVERDLLGRELTLSGNARGAAEAGLASRAIQEFERLQDLFRDGIISEDVLQRFNAVIEGELVAGLQALEDQARATAEAVAQVNRLTQEDLGVRRLVATGQAEAAADLRLLLDQERELRALREQGATEETLAILLQVQELERLRVASERLSEAEAQRLRLLEDERETQERLAKATEDRLRAERKLGQDLDVRFLAALGQQDAADELRRQVQNAREIEEAQNAGFSQTLIDFLRQVQEAERVRDLQDREDRLAAAIDPERALRPERTTSFDGRSITSSQADTMSAYLATIAINTGQLVRLAGGQPTTITRGATGAGGQALGGSSLSITINPASGETPGQALDRVLASQGQLEATASGSPPAL